MLSENIKERRKELRKTQEDIAKVVGVSKQTIQKYENGIISNIPSDKIELLAKALDCTPAYLMGWSKEKTATSGSLKTEKDILIEKVKQMSDEQVHAVLLILDSQHK